MTAPRLTALPIWVKVNNDGTITGRCLASTVSLAYLALPCKAGELVISLASYEAGAVRPRPVVGRLCPRCEVVIRDGEPTREDRMGLHVHTACFLRPGRKRGGTTRSVEAEEARRAAISRAITRLRAEGP